MDLKLKMELVPSTAWEQNFRNDVGQSKWKKIREAVYTRQNRHCIICGDSPKRLYCDEVWDYNMETKIQKLTGFKAVCGKCNMVLHYGFAQIQADKGLVDLNEIINHFMTVNNCSKDEFQEHKTESFKKHREMSQYQWKLDYEGYEALV